MGDRVLTVHLLGVEEKKHTILWTLAKFSEPGTMISRISQLQTRVQRSSYANLTITGAAVVTVRTASSAFHPLPFRSSVSLRGRHVTSPI